MVFHIVAGIALSMLFDPGHSVATNGSGLSSRGARRS
jgi:hypothetical protein